MMMHLHASLHNMHNANEYALACLLAQCPLILDAKAMLTDVTYRHHTYMLVSMRTSHETQQLNARNQTCAHSHITRAWCLTASGCISRNAAARCIQKHMRILLSVRALRATQKAVCTQMRMVEEAYSIHANVLNFHYIM